MKGYNLQQVYESRGKKNPEPGGKKTPIAAALSLGCAKNRIDTEEILGYLTEHGWFIAEDPRIADLIIVNTCSFIEQAQQESINALLKTVAENSNSGSKVIVCGCLVEIYGSKLLREIPGLAGAIGAHSYKYLGKFISLVMSGRRVMIRKEPADRYTTLGPRLLTSSPHSANVKIAEGCSNRCHYCLIPKIRGPFRSRPPEEIKAEIGNLLVSGTREINIIAQDTTAYGSENDQTDNLTSLLQQVFLEEEKYFWLRLMYTYPSRIDDQLVELIAAEKRFCHYLDLPIQHSSDQVLAGMARHYNLEDLKKLITKLRKEIPDLALRTTCMVGYPGECRVNFDQLLTFLKEYPFDHLGAFIYSPQSGTIAGDHFEPIPRRIAEHRLNELVALQRRISGQQNKKYLQQRLLILVDYKLDGQEHWYCGHSSYQAPEVDGKVYFRTKISLAPGDWVEGTIYAFSAYNLLAAKISKWQAARDQ